MASASADIGLIGLAVMGQNLVLNMNDHGFTVAVFNRTYARTEEFLAGPAKNTKIVGCKELSDFFAAIKRPRKVMFMVKAGQSVDDLIQECLPFLEKGDIVIDGGNSHYPDTQRREEFLKSKGIFYIGTGISGGEEGARHGPSIMPGGSAEAWPHVKTIFQAIAAKASDGMPCCDWIGEGGSGHYVKMVHNGIEYGDMQIICEGYQILRDIAGCSLGELHDIFVEWNRGELNSYLIEITAQIFAYKEGDGSYLLDKILDVAGQKGTGKWTGISAFEQDTPVTLIAEAVFARCLSSYKNERTEASKLFPMIGKAYQGDKKELIRKVGEALYASKIISYAQGFMLIQAAAKAMRWHLDYGAIAMMWRGGCIIRSQFLGKIKPAFDKDHDLPCLLLDVFFSKEMQRVNLGLREVVATAALHGVPAPCFSAALSFFDGFRSSKLPANLLQAQRDFFGAHTYERTDQARNKFFHTNWTGKGGNVSSTTYNA
ncbi:MAG: decarboxylating NADP(+)-dependent phosphogluconate dehydrogenase [Simkania sp.]|nr:decarboxylating NADP(+)-dependent phosphogluconate dehydrogenase [Simkania sp.]